MRGLRDYGVAGQLGLEPTPEEYVATMVSVFREVRRVLREDGTLWLNLGDSYATRWGSQRAEGRRGMIDNDRTRGGPVVSGLKEKDLVGIPWRVAFALQADGWWLRSDIVWSKPNPMPESVTDRPTKAHEYVFLLAKAERYFYDAEAVKEPMAEASAGRYGYAFGGAKSERLTAEEAHGPGTRTHPIGWREPGAGRNRRSVWTIATQPYPEAHFATFPPDLVRPCILAGTSARGCCASCGAPWERVTRRRDHGWDGSRYGERAVAASGGIRSGGFEQSTLGSSNGRLVGHQETLGWSPTCTCPGQRGRTVPAVVLDPFGGAMTTAVVAKELDRRAVMAELNPTYCAMGAQRVDGTDAQRALLF